MPTTAKIKTHKMIFKFTPRKIVLALALSSPWLHTTAAPITIADLNVVFDNVPDVAIVSHCPFPVYIKEVIGGTDINPYHPYSPGSSDIVIGPNGTFTSKYYWPNTGVSIKLARKPWIPYTVEPLMTQIEYTYEPDTQTLWYDLSEVDCYNPNPAPPPNRVPFTADTNIDTADNNIDTADNTVESTTNVNNLLQAARCPFFQHGVVIRAAPACEVLACAPGDRKCAAAYVTPTDGYETKCATGRTPRMQVDLCPKDFGGMVEELRVLRKSALEGGERVEVGLEVEMVRGMMSALA